MSTFLTRFGSKVKGVLSGLDRIRFRGTLRLIANLSGMHAWLSMNNILLKEFKDYSIGLTDRIKAASEQLADETGRPLHYLASSSTRKETVAREIAKADNITSGLVCILTAVEPCKTFTVGPNRELKKLELRYHYAKCLHHYFYVIAPYWGWLNVRLQTWFPFNVHVVSNGRERLACQLHKHGIGFEKRDNCFVDIDDVLAAQELFDRQRRTNCLPH